MPVEILFFLCDFVYNPWKTLRSINGKWIYAYMFFVIKGSIPGKCNGESCAKPEELFLFLCEFDSNPWKTLRGIRGKGIYAYMFICN